jgi:hypothetical protein
MLTTPSNNVTQLITLGTPFAGSPLATRDYTDFGQNLGYAQCISGYGAAVEPQARGFILGPSAGARDLSPDNAAANMAGLTALASRITQIAGDISTGDASTSVGQSENLQTAMFFSGCILKALSASPSDGIVPLASAQPAGTAWRTVTIPKRNHVALPHDPTAIAEVIQRLTTPVAAVTVAPSAASIAVGATQTFTATTKDASSNTLTGRTVTWTSMSPSVATINSATGLATAVAAGTATIKATSETKEGTATLTVTNVTSSTPSAAQSTLAVAPLTVAANGTATVTVTLKNASGQTVTAAGASAFVATASAGSLGTWSCSSGVCSATYTAPSSAGSATISATIGGTSISGSPATVSTQCAIGAECEPNNSMGTATNLAVGSTLSASISPASDEDWFRLQTSGASDLSVSVSAPAANGFFTILLYDAVGVGVACAESIVRGGPVTLTHLNAPSGLHVKVISSQGWSGSCPFTGGSFGVSTVAVAAYSISLSASVVGSDTDLGEPNNSMATSTSLTLGGVANASIGLMGDVDWYRLGNASTSNITLTLSTPGGTSQFTILLFDTSGNGVACAESAQPGMGVTLSRAAVPPAYYVKVIANSGWSGGCPYSGSFSLSTRVVGAYSLRFTTP